MRFTRKASGRRRHMSEGLPPRPHGTPEAPSVTAQRDARTWIESANFDLKLPPQPPHCLEGVTATPGGSGWVCGWLARQHVAPCS